MAEVCFAYPRAGAAAVNNAAHLLAPSGIAKQSQRKRVMWWHDAIIDEMIANPSATLGDIARKLGRAYGTIALVTASDVFRHRLAARRREHADNISQSIVENTTAVANRALELTLARLNGGDVAKIPTLQLYSIADKTLERLGYGVPKAPSVVVQQNVVTASADAIASAQADIRRRELEAVQRTSQNPSASAAAPSRTPGIANEVSGGSASKDIIDLIATVTETK